MSLEEVDVEAWFVVMLSNAEKHSAAFKLMLNFLFLHILNLQDSPVPY